MTDKFVTIEGKKLKLTNLQKELWPATAGKPEISKLDLINYFDKMAEYILPYLKDRPLSLKRFPDGINGESFFQKNIAEYKLPWMKTKKIQNEDDNEIVEYLVCNDKATLIYLANLAAIEIHPWLSRTESLSHPDFLLLDLDPSELPFSKATDVALVTKKLLDKLDISAFVKTSGKRGLHVVIPTAAKYSYGQVKDFAEILVHLIHKEIPEITSIERSPEKRQHKVYLDFMQNAEGQTMIAPYCSRAVDGASVSAPIQWQELNNNTNPKNFNIKNIQTRLKQKGNPWDKIFSGKSINIKKIIAAIDNGETNG